MKTTYQKFKKRLKEGGIIILDGGVGTELQRRGIEMDETWCGSASLNEETLKKIHLDYILAGCEIITTNTYASSRIMLDAANLGAHFEEINIKAIKAAFLASKKSVDKTVLIAGSLSHRFPICNGNKQSKPENKIDDLEFKSSCEELANFLTLNGCDLIILEMMYDPERMQTVMEAAQITGLPIWAGFSTRRGRNGDILSFTSEKEVLFEDLLDMALNYDFDVVGVMHTNVDEISDSLAILKSRFDLPLMVYLDSGGWVSPNWDFDNIIKPEELLKRTETWVNEGAQIIGGCCGLSPEHIAAISILRK